MNWGTRLAVGALLPLLGLLISNPVHAFGLGEARVDSFLNQPLDVQVRLLEVSEADLDSLTVRIGGAEDYERLGLMGEVLALNVSVSIDRSQSPPILRVRSQRSANDPIVQLLLDARWSSGRILREYTLFLDPPSIPAAPPPRPAAQQITPEPEATTPRPAPAETPVPASRAAAPGPAEESVAEAIVETIARPSAPAAGDDRYRVRRGDTLWSVAQRVRPDPGLSMNQTMLAIVDLNPSAFRDGNVHQMLSGVELQLPARDQIESIDRQFAEQTVRQQNRIFNQRLNAPVEVVADANPVTLDAPRTAADSQPADDTETTAQTAQDGIPADGSAQADEFRLELVPPVDGEEGLGLTAEANEANRLRQQLARAEEELFTARLEAEDFQERLTELETMVNDNPSGLGIRDIDLAQLEQTLRAARAATVDQADPALRAEVSDQLDRYLEQFAAAPPVEADRPSDAAALAQTPAQAVEQQAVEQDVADAEPQPPVEPVVTQIGQPRSGLSAWLGNPLVLLALGMIVLLIVLLVAWLVVKRARESAPRKPATVTSRSEPKVVAGDPVRVARQAVQQDPDDLAARLALLQALAGSGRTEDFSVELEAMYTRVDRDEEPVWLEALTLASHTVPDHPLVLGSIDWVAGGSEVSNPGSEIDEDEGVDELMLRMQDNSTRDDLDGIGMLTEEELRQHTQADAADDAETQDEGLDTPLLHEADRDEAWQPGIEDDLTDLGDPIESDSTHSDDADESTLAASDAADDPDVADHSVDESDSAADSSTSLSLDWPEADDVDDSLAFESPETSDAGGEEQAAGREDEDIFGTSDDDIDVKLDLARAYLSWNSIDSARTLLEEVVVEGNTAQREQAKKLLDDL